ncbi:unnamed protein product, partial [Staurois parvus]
MCHFQVSSHCWPSIFPCRRINGPPSHVPLICCQPPCAHTAAMCHLPVPLSALHTAGRQFFDYRVQADYGPHIAAARPLICHGPLYTASCCCQVQSLSWVPVRPPMLLSPSPHSAMCHFQV